MNSWGHFYLILTKEGKKINLTEGGGVKKTPAPQVRAKVPVMFGRSGGGGERRKYSL